jgi:hypothetical protein
LYLEVGENITIPEKCMNRLFFRMTHSAFQPSQWRLFTGPATVVSTMGLCMRKEPGTSARRMGGMLPAVGENWYCHRLSSMAILIIYMMIRSFLQA